MLVTVRTATLPAADTGVTLTTLEVLMVITTHTHTRTAARRRGGRVAVVHRVGAAAAGVLLAGFGALGLLSHLGALETMGMPVLGLTTTGLLSLISVVVAVILLAAAAVGGPAASTVTAVVGTGFVVSGLVNLAVLGTLANVLAFTFPNVVFSLVMGTTLIMLGLYGRLSGGLPVDNPYRLARARAHSRATTTVGVITAGPEVGTADMQVGAELDRWSLLELRVGDGRGTPEENEVVLTDLRLRAQLAHDRAWARVGRGEPAR